ncbi:MAG: aldehyde dehydrogenase family protein, partial [Leptospiraceae bacterium]|nr:aldehyde dehydrogenase family protein [Leptospiraceae bacterium]
ERTLAHEVVFTDNAMREEIEHEPLGVIANISAWNYPWFVSSNVFIPALLAGNAVLYKPSEYALLTGQLMADWLKKSGVPDAIFGVVFGGGEAGALLVDQLVDGIFFTGSYATGQKIAQRVAGRMLKLQLELGGKDPAYVTDDVDIAFAAESTADGAMYNTGQSCCSVERLYVHEKIYPEFIAHFVETVRNYKIGDPESEDTYIGALTRGKAALDFLLAQIGDAVKRGGKILCGGKPVACAAGFFLEPTVIENADHSMALMREESFGPVIGVMKVRSDEEAIQLMNDTDYGLTAAVYCRDLERAKRILSQVKTGTAYANCCDRVSPRLPWSGRNKSGVGLTLSRYGIETFTQPKAWHLRQIG